MTRMPALLDSPTLAIHPIHTGHTVVKHTTHQKPVAHRPIIPFWTLLIGAVLALLAVVAGVDYCLNTPLAELFSIDVTAPMLAPADGLVR